MQQIDGALLEHARPHPIDHVLAAAVLDDDRIDAVQMQQLAEQQPGRTRADDADLGLVRRGLNLFHFHSRQVLALEPCCR